MIDSSGGDGHRGELTLNLVSVNQMNVLLCHKQEDTTSNGETTQPLRSVCFIVWVSN